VGASAVREFKIPNFTDIPPLKTAVMENVPAGPGPYNSLTIGKLGNVPAAAAVADAVDTAFALVLRRVLLANGLDMTKGDYELVALGATGARLESMIKGETYAAILNPPFDAKALAAGMRRIGDSKEVLPDYPNTILAVNREWAQKNRDTLVSYLRAWLKGMSWVKEPANREAAIKMVGAELKLNPKQATESVNELSLTGNLNLPGLQVVLDLRTQFGFKLNKGDKLPVYYDAAYFNVARGK
jgi:ABC-type nitrate/sulfonate/bicarbonate transport system substrate-binding protein